uniref:S100/CaBP-9k-type calcium binding subdomain domain-containing protein n=1 Tax=Neogobius melanostomus TaxID=47308 RepID=A0A8C6SC85_9GOBI
MSEVQQAMALLISSFSKYAGKEGDQHTLSKTELKEMLHNEFGDMLGKASDKGAIDTISRTWTPTKTTAWTSRSSVTWWSASPKCATSTSSARSESLQLGTQ